MELQIQSLNTNPVEAKEEGKPTKSAKDIHEDVRPELVDQETQTESIPNIEGKTIVSDF